MALKQEGKAVFYYVDSIGFKKMEDFQPVTLNRGVGERGEVKEEKTSVLERLRKFRDEQADQVKEESWREENAL